MRSVGVNSKYQRPGTKELPDLVQQHIRAEDGREVTDEVAPGGALEVGGFDELFRGGPPLRLIGGAETEGGGRKTWDEKVKYHPMSRGKSPVTSTSWNFCLAIWKQKRFCSVKLRRLNQCQDNSAMRMIKRPTSWFVVRQGVRSIFVPP
jgi:hypothetical protein